MIATFEVAARSLTRPHLETESHDLVGGKIPAKATTFEGAEVPLCAT